MEIYTEEEREYHSDIIDDAIDFLEKKKPNFEIPIEDHIDMIIGYNAHMDMLKGTEDIYDTEEYVKLFEHSEILDMYREIIDPEFQYTLFSYEDQKKVIACERSNNELDTQKLQSLFPEVKSIKESVRDVLMTMKRRIWNN